MFSNIFSRNEAQHPLSTPHGVRRVIGTFDKTDPVMYMRELNEALHDVDEIASTTGIDTAYPALGQLRQASRATVSSLISGIVTENGPLYMNEMARAALDTHSSATLNGFVRFVRENVSTASTETRLEVSKAAVHAFRALALGMKLQRCFYRLPLAIHWKAANDLLALLSANNLERRTVSVFPREPQTTPLMEYLYCLYSEVIPANNLVPMQMELLESFVRSRETLDFGTEFTKYSTHMIDITKSVGPKRIFRDSGDVPDMDPGARFCSTVDLHEQLQGLVEDVFRKREVPKWLAAVPLGNQMKESALRLTCQHWMPDPPYRKAERTFNSFDIMVVKGLDRMRTMLAISDKVRKYVMTPTDPMSFTSEEHPESSFDFLYRLEAEVKDIQVENWTQTDSSETGFAATTKASLLQNRIGTPIAFRYSDGLYWQAGVIRRIGRDPKSKPSIGISFVEPNQVV